MTGEIYIHISINGLTFATLLVSLLDSIFIHSDIKGIVAFFNDTSLNIQIK